MDKKKFREVDLFDNPPDKFLMGVKDQKLSFIYSFNGGRGVISYKMIPLFSNSCP